MTVVYYKLNHVVILTEATILHMLSLLEQINAVPGTSYAAIDLANIILFSQ